jgi:chromosomal replication initiation ATPase DnaA
MSELAHASPARLPWRAEAEAILERLCAEGLIPLLAEVCFEHGVEPRELVSRGRHRRLVRARFDLYWRIRSNWGLSFPKIGEVFGRDHTTIMHGIEQHLLVRKKTAGWLTL